MARHMDFNDVPTYRAVILATYGGIEAQELELKSYTKSDGTVVQYHTATAYGPYGAKGTASAQMNREVKWNGERQYWNTYRYGKPQIEAFVEASTPVWNLA